MDQAPVRTITLSDLPAGSIVRRIAAAMIARHGSYTYTEMSTGAKVRVTR